MKCIKHNLGKFEEIRILPLADLHLGDTNSDFKKLMEYINFIKDNDNVFTILNGDLMDSATRYSIGDVYGATCSPMEQLKQCVKLFPAVVKTGYFRVSASNNSAQKVDKLFVNTAATLQYGGYGELQSYKPTSIEMPMIILDGTKHNMKAVL